LTSELSSRPLSYTNRGFQAKVLQWFNGDLKLIEEFKQQKITTVYNKWTRVTTAYNSIRGQTPKHVQKQDVSLHSVLQLNMNLCLFLQAFNAISESEYVKLGPMCCSFLVSTIWLLEIGTFIYTFTEIVTKFISIGGYD
jgi:hypothetical protein